MSMPFGWPALRREPNPGLYMNPAYSPYYYDPAASCYFLDPHANTVLPATSDRTKPPAGERRSHRTTPVHGTGVEPGDSRSVSRDSSESTAAESVVESRGRHKTSHRRVSDRSAASASDDQWTSVTSERTLEDDSNSRNSGSSVTHIDDRHRRNTSSGRRRHHHSSPSASAPSDYSNVDDSGEQRGTGEEDSDDDDLSGEEEEEETEETEETLETSEYTTVGSEEDKDDDFVENSTTGDSGGSTSVWEEDFPTSSEETTDARNRNMSASNTDDVSWYEDEEEEMEEAEEEDEFSGDSSRTRRRHGDESDARTSRRRHRDEETSVTSGSSSGSSSSSSTSSSTSTSSSSSSSSTSTTHHKRCRCRHCLHDNSNYNSSAGRYYATDRCRHATQLRDVGPLGRLVRIVTWAFVSPKGRIIEELYRRVYPAELPQQQQQQQQHQQQQQGRRKNQNDAAFRQQQSKLRRRSRLNGSEGEERSGEGEQEYVEKDEEIERLESGGDGSNSFDLDTGEESSVDRQLFDRYINRRSRNNNNNNTSHSNNYNNNNSVVSATRHVTNDSQSQSICEHFVKLGRFTHDLYLKGKCTDLTVQITSSNSKTGSTSVFKVHRTVVTCHSSWFAEQVLDDGQWCVGDVVYLDDVCRNASMSATTFHNLLEYMYTGHVVIDATNVVQLLVAAEKLGMPEIMQQCCAAVDIMTLDKMLQVITAACDSGLSDVAALDLKWQHLALNFSDVVRSRPFLQLSVDSICRLLSRDDLYVASERDIVDAALRWINADRSARPVHVARVFNCVRFNLLRPEELVWLANAENYLLTDQTVREKILEANWLHTSSRAKVKQTPPAMTSSSPL